MSSVALKEKELRHELSKIFDSFKTRAEAVSAEVYRFATEAQAADFILETLKKEGIKDEPNSYAVWANSMFADNLDKEDLAKSIPGLKFEFTTKDADKAKIGITQMHWALADTGTLAEESNAIDCRLAASLTEIHIAVVATENIFPDMLTFLKKTDPCVPAYLSFITGPSRTSDIERVLTIGVHGPERLIIVFVDELGGGK